MYILVTPAKNEEEHLPQLIESVLSQTIQPILWVIVDDNSQDKTSILINAACKKHQWIKYTKLIDSSEYDWLGYGRVVKHGFTHAQKIAESENINYDFLGILDADIVLSNTYFEYLIEGLNEDPTVGITSGTLYIKTKKGTVPEDNSDCPRGGARLYRRFCFEDIGGFSELPSPDTVSDIKAMNRGWNLTRTKKAGALHNRKSSSTRGLWNGYKKMGEGRYYLNFHPFAAFLSGLYIAKNPPFYQGFAYIYGYFKSYVTKNGQTNDDEIMIYFAKGWNKIKMKAKKDITRK
ncbi:glycosyltransferase family A protein [Methanolobus mangrovi]|uniref:Glycosyltransferase family A protein n=1 Tax=Methanolobus mangrovi TaxID=3072977 RepID=A0AA51YJJ4_9EURY|nr:glycosyltransferase family A protein [Methanolobus mangrovi]WMW22219.1 glycosyltransferase family A protein [Methanolobus mangrovi]